MAKRSARPGKAVRPQSYSKGAPSPRNVAPSKAAGSAAITPLARAGGRAAAAMAMVPKVDFATEYHYVIQDLRRLFTLAAGLLVLLSVLAFFLTR